MKMKNTLLIMATILNADKETRRDGFFIGSPGSKSWIYILSSAAHPVIKLPGSPH